MGSINNEIFLVPSFPDQVVGIPLSLNVMPPPNSYFGRALHWRGVVIKVLYLVCKRFTAKKCVDGNVQRWKLNKPGTAVYLRFCSFSLALCSKVLCFLAMDPCARAHKALLVCGNVWPTVNFGIKAKSCISCGELHAAETF